VTRSESSPDRIFQEAALLRELAGAPPGKPRARRGSAAGDGAVPDAGRGGAGDPALL